MTTTNSKSQEPSLPPASQVSPGTWVKKNLFSTWYNSILTIICLLFIYWVATSLIGWAFNQAKWTVLTANLRIFLVGYYPEALLWRPWTVLGIIVGLAGFSWGILSESSTLFNRSNLIILTILATICVAIAPLVGGYSSSLLLGMLVLLILTASLVKKLAKSLPFLKTWLVSMWVLSFFVVLWLLIGGWFLEPVRLANLSGLILTLLVAVVSIFLSFPFGVLLALGRQSELPAIHWLATAYIELIRGVPLIGILFMAQIMLPLVLPSDVLLDQVIRAIAGYTIFTAAYVAENVRGGLQSVPSGQTEAAQALGLSSPLVVTLIVLPQAIRAVIPTIVGQFISLFKDTSLLAIVSLVDLLGISQSILANPKYTGRSAETYLFIGLIYWICCYSMSLASRKLESEQLKI
ncbi:amino acid ABC transporter permease [Pleurocapsa sp. PCC 7319]|uniref:amino acid ABC transporter permease n=1 Tax=Pleurocapsa sp. PCC 7319 TaxID=118161 RepID=UPI00034AA407|nr:amino acid ABC transporter permease [Pleurocapsa sp. PCC 7319]